MICSSDKKLYNCKATPHPGIEDARIQGLGAGCSSNLFLFWYLDRELDVVRDWQNFFFQHFGDIPISFPASIDVQGLQRYITRSFNVNNRIKVLAPAPPPNI